MSRNKVNEKGTPYGARQKMPFWYSLAWSTRGGVNCIECGAGRLHHILLHGYFGAESGRDRNPSSYIKSH